MAQITHGTTTGTKTSPIVGTGASEHDRTGPRLSTRTLCNAPGLFFQAGSLACLGYMVVLVHLRMVRKQ